MIGGILVAHILRNHRILWRATTQNRNTHSRVLSIIEIGMRDIIQNLKEETDNNPIAIKIQNIMTGTEIINMEVRTPVIDFIPKTITKIVKRTVDITVEIEKSNSMIRIIIILVIPSSQNKVMTGIPTIHPVAIAETSSKAHMTNTLKNDFQSRIASLLFQLSKNCRFLTVWSVPKVIINNIKAIILI